MLYKSARGLMAWFTLFFIWSAFVLWYHGVALLQFIMHDSNLYAFSLALRQTRSDMLPVVLLMMLVLAVGAFLSSVTVAMINAVAFLFRTAGALLQAQFSQTHARRNTSSFH